MIRTDTNNNKPLRRRGSTPAGPGFRAFSFLLCLSVWLSAGQLFGVGVRLVWDPSPDANVAGYQVYRSDGIDGPYALVSQELLVAAGFQDLSAEAGRVYYYAVSAVGLNGRESDLSAPLEVEVAAAGPGESWLETAPERIVRSGELTILPIHEWPQNRLADSSGKLEWRQVEGPEVVMVYEGSKALAFLAPEVVQPTRLVFQLGSQRSIRFILDVAP